jgi:hypothetical protein
LGSQSSGTSRQFLALSAAKYWSSVRLLYIGILPNGQCELFGHSRRWRPETRRAAMRM